MEIAAANLQREAFRLSEEKRRGQSGRGKPFPSRARFDERRAGRGGAQTGATYTGAYIQQLPPEPRAGMAPWKEGKLEAWTGSQRPFGVHEELVQAFQLKNEDVRVIVPDTGAAYGGKHTGEAAVEAARLAKAVGKPVHLLWTREEELTWAYFRPAGVIEVKSGASADGILTAWEFHNYNSGAAGIGTPYEVANQVVEFHQVKEPPLRQGSYRALAATANHFARESHMDELAHAAGMDPLEFRMKNLKDERLRAVFDAAAKQFVWDAKRSEEHTSELQSPVHLVCRLLLEKKKKNYNSKIHFFTKTFYTHIKNCI